MRIYYCSVLAVILLAVAILFVPSANATIHEIQVGNFFFSPLNTVVTQGDTVRWVLVTGTHSTTSDGSSPKAWDSGISGVAGVLLELEFTTSDPPGDYPYHCTVHAATMKDTLRVVAAPSAGGGTAYSFTLDESQADACNGTGSVAVGSGSAILSADSSELEIVVIHSVTDPIDAHIHTAAPCVSGGITYGFASSTSPIVDTVPLTSQMLSDLIAGNLYVNIHSTSFPNGEIRGQIANPECISGDPDGNGSTSIGDAVYIINYIFGGGPPPVCP